MGGLPPVPNMDPNPAPSAGEADLPAPVGDVETSAPKPVPAPRAPPSKEITEDDPAPIQDSVEEVLHQSTDQALRLSHLEDILTEVNQTLTDIRDEMHAGFAEIRAVIEEGGGAAGQRPTEATFQSSLTELLDVVEERAVQGNKRHVTLMVAAAVQAILLLVTLAVVLLTRDSDESSLPPPSYMSSGEQPADPLQTIAPPPPEVPRPKAKRRRNRRR